MEEIIKLTELDFSSLFVSVFIILIGLRAVVSAFEWIIEKLGIESKSSRSKKEDHNLLIRTSQNLAALQEEHVRDVEKSDARDDKISSDPKADHVTKTVFSTVSMFMKNMKKY